MFSQYQAHSSLSVFRLLLFRPPWPVFSVLILDHFLFILVIHNRSLSIRIRTLYRLCLTLLQKVLTADWLKIISCIVTEYFHHFLEIPARSKHISWTWCYEIPLWWGIYLSSYISCFSSCVFPLNWVYWAVELLCNLQNLRQGAWVTPRRTCRYN